MRRSSSDQYALSAHSSGSIRRQNCRIRTTDILRLAHFAPTSAGTSIALGVAMSASKNFVYVLKNADEDPHFYVGVTHDVADRLATHNAGGCPHTAKHRPWRLHVVIEFPDEQRALRFERYLKSGSGRAFAKRHFED
jgi:predicted GIY-YIG superfamily endonuclease